MVRRFAGRAPGLANVIHHGRRSGRRYTTPVNVFRSDSGFVIALTYGSGADWVANVLHAGRCTMVHRGSEIELHHPRMLDVETGMAAMPAPVRAALRLLNVTEFLALDVAGADPGG